MPFVPVTEGGPVRTLLLLGWVLASLASATLLPAIAHSLTPSPFLVNGGFEEWESGQPVGWRLPEGRAESISAASDPERVVEGEQALALIADESRRARITQLVALQHGATYRLSGRLLVDDLAVQLVRLEIGWTNALGQPDHQRVEQFGSTGGEYLRLVTPDAHIPCGASNVRVSIFLRATLGATSALAYLDDLQLKRVIEASPCPTPTLAATPTPLPVATPAPRPTVAPLPTTAPIATPPPLASPTPSHGLLINGGFEAADAGVPLGWLSRGGLLSQASVPVHTGRFAASLMSFTTSTK